MEIEEVNALIDELLTEQPVALSDIPEIELYMDQVTEFIDLKLSAHKREPKDKLLTKTMINNYTRAGILMPSRRKRYSRQHIALLLLLYNSKQVLSIRDIAILFGILQKPGGKHNELEADSTLIDLVYELAREMNWAHADRLKIFCAENIEPVLEKTASIEKDKRESIRWFLMALSLVSQAAMQKRLAETIIDRHFSGSGVPPAPR